MTVQYGAGLWLVFVLIAAGPLALGLGCSKKSEAGPSQSGGSCHSSSDCLSAERCDATTERCVPKCTADNQCPRDSGTRCDEGSGECVSGEHCQHDFNCGTDPAHEYCKGIDCVCVDDASVLAAGAKVRGICRRPAAICEPCVESNECGEGLITAREAGCRTFLNGEGPEGVCLPKQGRRCPPGMLAADRTTNPDLAGFCIPQGGDCGSLTACESDRDCPDPEQPACDLVRQVCTPGCSFDVLARQTEGCSPGQVCNAKPQWLEPSLLDSCETAHLFGLGTCSASCESDTECRAIDPSFVCKNDGGGSRCRPEGCVDDSECRSGLPGFSGFCELRTGQCVMDACRLGVDSTQGCGNEKTHDDCETIYKCVGGEGERYGGCEEKNCIEQGGALAACNVGNFCAGEPFRDPITQEVLTRLVETPPGVEAGSCYAMPRAAWCEASCEEPSDCLQGGPTFYPDSPSACGEFGLDHSICFWGCEYQQECPSAWSCSSKGLELECGFRSPGAGLQRCEEDEDCASGGRCVAPIFNGIEQHVEFKVCACGDDDACSSGYDCNAGVATANLRVGEPDYMKVKARYCSNSTPCGPEGSCEWFGVLEEYSTGTGSVTAPVFQCANAPAAMEGAEARCPARDSKGQVVRAGKSASDQFLCVYSSICQPGFVPSDPTDPFSSLTCRSL